MGKRKRAWKRNANQRRAAWMKHQRIRSSEIRAEGLLSMAFIGSVVAFETSKRVVLMHREWLTKIYSPDR